MSEVQQTKSIPSLPEEFSSELDNWTPEQLGQLDTALSMLYGKISAYHKAKKGLKEESPEIQTTYALRVVSVCEQNCKSKITAGKLAEELFRIMGVKLTLHVIGSPERYERVEERQASPVGQVIAEVHNLIERKTQS